MSLRLNQARQMLKKVIDIDSGVTAFSFDAARELGGCCKNFVGNFRKVIIAFNCIVLYTTAQFFGKCIMNGI